MKHTSAPVAAGDHSRRGGCQWLDAGSGRGGLDEFAQQRQFPIGVDQIVHRVRTTRRSRHW